MLRTIIKKELLEKILTLRFFVAFLLSIGLTTISALVLSNNYAQELTDYHSRVKLHAETSNKDGTYGQSKAARNSRHCFVGSQRIRQYLCGSLMMLTRNPSKLLTIIRFLQCSPPWI